VIPVGIYEADVTGTVTYLNKNWCDFAGIPPGGPLGLGWLNAIHPDDRQAVLSEWSESVNHSRQFQAEYRLISAAGRITWLLDQAEPRLNSADTIDGYIGTVTDISNLKETARQIPKLAHIFDSLDLGIAIGELPSERLESANLALAGMHGYEVDELIGRSIFQLYAPEDIELAQQAGQIATEQGTHVFEARRLRKNGSVFPALIRISVVKDEAGESLYRSAIVQDITAQKETESMIVESERKFRALFDKAPIAHFAADKNGRLINANQKAGQLLGTTPDKLIGRTVLSLYADAPDGKPKAEQLVKRWKQGEQIENEELIMEHCDGHQIWISLTATPVLSDEKEIIVTQASAIDITARKQAEIEKLKLIEKLELKNAEMERFTYTVSHDLKSPLITINGFLGMLERDLEDKDPEKIREDVNYIKTAADNMYLQLQQLLDLSEAVNKIVQYEAVPLRALIQAALDKVRGQITESGAIVNIQPRLPVIYCEVDRMIEVFQNLIDNAIKFRRGSEVPHIDIKARKIGPNVLCTVTDDGIGIDDRYQDKIFDLFERVDQRISGTGIGLALVKGIIEKHQGSISVESEGADMGTTFRLSIPANNNHEAAVSELQ